MPFVASNLALVSSVNGFGLYRYDTTDALADVDAAGYVNNATHNQKLAVGDVIEVVSWTTAVRTGTIADVGRVIVMAVAGNGAVDLSNDLLGITVANAD